MESHENIIRSFFTKSEIESNADAESDSSFTFTN